MRTRTMIYVGVGLIVLGILALISNLTGVNFGTFCFPVGLIALGLLVLFRPRMTRDGVEVHFELLGEIRRGGVWQVKAEELWTFIGDTKLDFSQAQLPEGETMIRINNFIGDITLSVPPGFALALNTDTVISSVKWFGAKQDQVLSGLELTTPEFANSDRSVRVKVFSLIGDIKVKPA
jgi:hypothetical protein